MSENADEIKNANLIDESPSIRVDNAINNALAVCMKRLQNKMIEIESEASFQHHLALLIRDYLQFFTLSDDEKFIISLEKKYELNGHNNYVDIVIEYHKKHKFEFEYLVELKFKKEKSGINKAIILSFIDIYNLEQLLRDNVNGCFIFLTFKELYAKEPQKDEKDKIREKFPMWDGAKIKPKTYEDNGKTANRTPLKNLGGLEIEHTYEINYKKMTTNKNENFWFFKLKIPPK